MDFYGNCMQIDKNKGLFELEPQNNDFLKKFSKHIEKNRYRQNHEKKRWCRCLRSIKMSFEYDFPDQILPKSDYLCCVRTPWGTHTTEVSKTEYLLFLRYRYCKTK